jgi:hypothetical protein
MSMFRIIGGTDHTSENSEPVEDYSEHAREMMARYAQASNGDRAFALIEQKLIADIAHGNAIDEQDKAEGQYGFQSAAARKAANRCSAACHRVNTIDWRLANTTPTTLVGVVAVLRFANDIEDAGLEWPSTDTIGREGWHYQLRKTMAQAIETIITNIETIVAENQSPGMPWMT